MTAMASPGNWVCPDCGCTIRGTVNRAEHVCAGVAEWQRSER